MSNVPIDSSNTSIQQMANALVRRFDANSDGKLSGAEFADVLRNLLGSLTESPIEPRRAPVTTTAAAADNARYTSSQPGAYRHMLAGFDWNRMADLNDTEVKYVFARIAQDYAPTPENLKIIAEKLGALGYPCTVVNDDVLDFGDGWPQDVIRDVNGPDTAWQFMNVD